MPAMYKGQQRMIQFGASGSPDVIAITSGLFVGVECKRPGRKMSEAQEAFRRNVESAGGYYLLVHSEEELIEGLDQVSKKYHGRINITHAS